MISKSSTPFGQPSPNEPLLPARPGRRQRDESIGSAFYTKDPRTARRLAEDMRILMTKRPTKRPVVSGDL